MKSYKYTLEGLDCANCAKKIEDEIAKTKGYEDVIVNFSTLKLTFKSDNPNAKKEVTEIVKKLEPDVEVLDDGEKKQEKEEHNDSDIARIVIGIAIYLIALIGNLGTIITNMLTIISFVVLLYKTAKKAWKQVTKNKVLDENTLIVISAIGQSGHRPLRRSFSAPAWSAHRCGRWSLPGRRSSSASAQCC